MAVVDRDLPDDFLQDLVRQAAIQGDVVQQDSTKLWANLQGRLYLRVIEIRTIYQKFIVCLSSLRRLGNLLKKSGNTDSTYGKVYE